MYAEIVLVLLNDGDMTIDGDVTEKVSKFSYLGDVLGSGRRVHEAVIARIRCGRKKFKDKASAIHKKAV